jgi:hypothetical protein
MTDKQSGRLQFFFACNCVIPSEVEESLDLIWIWRAITTFGFILSPTAITLSSTSELRTASHAELGSIAKEIAGFAADIRDAIARETQLKKWSRTKKVAPIKRLNPSWRDLGADVLQDR